MTKYTVIAEAFAFVGAFALGVIYEREAQEEHTCQ